MYEKYEALLKKNNTNSYQVSIATGITQSSLYNWKAGRYTPKADKLKKICDYFKVPITYFYD